MRNFKTLVWTATIAIGGVVLYVPAAIGLVLAEAFRPRRPSDDAWRFTPANVEKARPLSVTRRRKADLWAQMNLQQYFTVVPGPTAVARGYCAFSRAV